MNKEYQGILNSQVLNRLITLEDVAAHRVVRTLSSRTISHLTPSSPEIPPLYLKEYRLTGVMNRVRGVFVNLARREWYIAWKLRERTIPTFIPLAVGEYSRWGFPGKSYFISKSIEDARSLKEYVGDHYGHQVGGDFSEKKKVIIGLARFVKDLHQKGVLHKDFHWGNILIQRGEQGGYRFYLLDLHRVECKSRLTERERIENLASLNTGISQQVKGTARLRFLKAYLEGEVRSGEGYPRVARLIEERTERMLSKLRQKKEKRCLGENKYFVSLKGTRYSGIINRECCSPELLTLLQIPDQAFSEAMSTTIKDSHTTSSCLLSLRISGENARLYIKRYNYQNFFYALKYLMRASRAKRVWRNSHGVVARNIPTPHPIAFMEQRRGRLLLKSFFISQGIDDARSLAALLREEISTLPQEAYARKCGLLQQGARLVRQMHDRGVYHRDLKASNILVCRRRGQEEELFLIDLDSAKITQGVTQGERMRDLARLSASLLTASVISTTDRLRFLRYYLKAWKRRDPRVREYWRKIIYYTQSKFT